MTTLALVDVSSCCALLDSSCGNVCLLCGVPRLTGKLLLRENLGHVVQSVLPNGPQM